jgi:hypothetical protein
MELQKELDDKEYLQKDITERIADYKNFDFTA